MSLAMDARPGAPIEGPGSRPVSSVPPDIWVPRLARHHPSWHCVSMTDPEIAESAITRRYDDSLVIEIPWSPDGYILEVACLRGDGPGGGQFYSQVFKILDDSGDAGAVWNSEDAPGGGARWITGIDEFADALDECPVPGIDRNSLTPRVRKLLLDEQRLLLEPEAESS